MRVRKDRNRKNSRGSRAALFERELLWLEKKTDYDKSTESARDFLKRKREMTSLHREKKARTAIVGVEVWKKFIKIDHTTL